MRELAWKIVAAVASTELVRHWLIKRAVANPYSDIYGPDGSLYMARGWVFNPYGKDENNEPLPPRWTWLPSIRVHLIKRPDSDRHLHDHPWNARTIVLEGWYTEERYHEMKAYGGPERKCHIRTEGYTGRLLFGQYHRIVRVSNDGVYTLFFTWKYRGTWGLDVNGIKMPYREYLNREKQK